MEKKEELLRQSPEIKRSGELQKENQIEVPVEKPENLRNRLLKKELPKKYKDTEQYLDLLLQIDTFEKESLQIFTKYNIPEEKRNEFHTQIKEYGIKYTDLENKIDNFSLEQDREKEKELKDKIEGKEDPHLKAKETQAKISQAEAIVSPETVGQPVTAEDITTIDTAPNKQMLENLDRKALLENIFENRIKSTALGRGYGIMQSFSAMDLNIGIVNTVFDLIMKLDEIGEDDEPKWTRETLDKVLEEKQKEIKEELDSVQKKIEEIIGVNIVENILPESEQAFEGETNEQTFETPTQKTSQIDSPKLKDTENIEEQVKFEEPASTT